jgi:hypothetical protein
VTVVERAPELRPGGQAVDARGVAKEVVRRMGLDTAVRPACTDTSGGYTVDADGNVLEAHRTDDDGGDGYTAGHRSARGRPHRTRGSGSEPGTARTPGDFMVRSAPRLFDREQAAVVSM